MPQTATVESIARAFHVMKSMRAQGIEWGDDYRRSAGGIPLDDEGADAPVARVHVGLGEDGHEVGDPAVRDEMLGAAQAVALPLARIPARSRAAPALRP